jgi:membrane-bound ClpP family serine protease
MCYSASASFAGGGIIAVIGVASLVYYNPAIWSYEFAGAYILVTCGSLLLASERLLVLFGVLNLAAIAAVVAWREQTLTSVWCAYAAFMSVLLYRYLTVSRVHRSGESAAVSAR